MNSGCGLEKRSNSLRVTGSLGTGTHLSRKGVYQGCPVIRLRPEQPREHHKAPQSIRLTHIVEILWSQQETPHQPPNPSNNPDQRKQDSACDDHADAVFLVFLNIQSKRPANIPKIEIP